MNARTIGMIGGLIVGIIICIVVAIASNNNRRIKTEYDERQKEVRGKGFECGFYTAIVLLGLLAVLGIAEVNIPMEQPVIYMTVVCLAVTSDAVYNIMNEGYWGLNNNKRRYGFFMALIALLNLGIAFICYKEGNLVNDGKLGLNGINLICCIMFLVLFVAIIIKGICTTNEEGED